MEPHISFICIYSANRDEFNDPGNINAPLVSR